MIKAKDAIIAWNGADGEMSAKPPAGAIAIGPLLQKDEGDWASGYQLTGGAANTDRRDMSDADQKFHVMRDWYELVYGYGLHPFVVHTAFLQIQEYQEITKEMGMGPAKGEPGHDPEVGYGRAVDYPVPEIEIGRIGKSMHVWPKSKS